MDRVNRIVRHIQPKDAKASSGYKVAVVGAAGGIGQPLSLLMKACPLVSELSLYDVVGTPGVTFQAALSTR